MLEKEVFEVDEKIFNSCAGQELAKLGIDTADNRLYCHKKYIEYLPSVVAFINSISDDNQEKRELVCSYLERLVGSWFVEALDSSNGIEDNICRAIAYPLMLKCYRDID